MSKDQTRKETTDSLNPIDVIKVVSDVKGGPSDLRNQWPHKGSRTATK